MTGHCRDWCVLLCQRVATSLEALEKALSLARSLSRHPIGTPSRRGCAADRGVQAARVSARVSRLSSQHSSSSSPAGARTSLGPLSLSLSLSRRLSLSSQPALQLARATLTLQHTLGSCGFFRLRTPLVAHTLRGYQLPDMGWGGRNPCTPDVPTPIARCSWQPSGPVTPVLLGCQCCLQWHSRERAAAAADVALSRFYDGGFARHRVVSSPPSSPLPSSLVRMGNVMGNVMGKEPSTCSSQNSDKNLIPTKTR